MHIAHSLAEFLTVDEVAKRVGLKRRQIANLARAGEINGARRSPDGYHFEYPVSKELLMWISEKKKSTIRQRQKPARKLASGRGILPHDVATAWKYFSKGVDPIKYSKEDSDEVRALLMTLVNEMREFLRKLKS